MDMTRQTAPENDRGERQGAFSLLGTASTMGLHMVSGPVVGAGLGWLIDEWIGSWPIASAIGLFLGVWAGFRNVWADARYLARSNAANDAAEAEKVALEKGEDEKNSGINEVHNSVTSAPAELVPDRNKLEGVLPPQSRPSFAPDVPLQSGDADGSDDDFLTASILAGTAVSGEKGLDEKDETLEAIRRILKQDAVDVPSKGMAEGAGKGPGAGE